MNIGEEIRVDVLNVEGVKVGPVVFGCKTFMYRLTGAPLEWNAVGIARALDMNIRKNRVEYVNKEHLDILYSALCSNYREEDMAVWLEIYQNLKQYLYRALADSSLCVLASEIIKKVFLIPSIKQQVMDISKDDFKKFLSRLY